MVLIFVDLTHLPVGLILPLLSHSRVLKVLRTQMNTSKPLNKRIHQTIITQKVRNQANVIKIKGHEDTFRRLLRMLPDITSGDSNNIEGQAAFIYFRTLFGNNFKRRQESIENSALNYAYTIVRSLSLVQSSRMVYSRLLVFFTIMSKTLLI
ncbi:type II CRISPR-associated endonuclease Cas1 [Aliikangiella sp. IMCC44359]|uniref:type II CRISPR-associated endonuclease Cas1 n=1 Tax=Aliikangiella sp. IMCC44359 TaxID=3459125 RepID=UPI00403AE3A2